MEWETGEITFEPLSVIGTDDPVTCAAYAEQHDLLAIEGWQRLRNLAMKDKVPARAINQSKIRQVRRSQTYMFGYLIPRNYMGAVGTNWPTWCPMHGHKTTQGKLPSSHKLAHQCIVIYLRSNGVNLGMIPSMFDCLIE